MLDSVMLTSFADELGEMRKEALNPYLAAGLGAAGLGAAGVAGGALMGGAGGAGASRLAQRAHQNIDYRALAEGHLSPDEYRRRQTARLHGTLAASGVGAAGGAGAGLAGGALAGGALAGGAALAAPHIGGLREAAGRGLTAVKGLGALGTHIGTEAGRLAEKGVTGEEAIRTVARGGVSGALEGAMLAPPRAATVAAKDTAREVSRAASGGAGLLGKLKAGVVGAAEGAGRAPGRVYKRLIEATHAPGMARFAPLARHVL